MSTKKTAKPEETAPRREATPLSTVPVTDLHRARKAAREAVTTPETRRLEEEDAAAFRQQTYQ